MQAVAALITTGPVARNFYCGFSAIRNPCAGGAFGCDKIPMLEGRNVRTASHPNPPELCARLSCRQWVEAVEECRQGKRRGECDRVNSHGSSASECHPFDRRLCCIALLHPMNLRQRGTCRREPRRGSACIDEDASSFS